MTTQSPRNKGQCSSVGPAQRKGKLRPIYTPRKCFPRNSDIECSAYPSSLLTYIIHPCTRSPLASRCQLAPPAPSPLAHELNHATAALPVAACECRRRRRQLVSPASSSFLRYARCPPPPPRPEVRAPSIPPSVRPTSPLPPFPWLHQSHYRADTTAINHAARYVHPSLNCQSSSPPPSPRETSRHSFLDSSSPPPRTESYQY
jgi:hypothetical protein